MKFFKFIFLIFTFFIFLAREDLSFSDADIFSPEGQPVQEIPTPKAENEETPNVAENSERISEEETTYCIRRLGAFRKFSHPKQKSCFEYGHNSNPPI